MKKEKRCYEKKVAADFFLRAVSLHVDNCMWRRHRRSGNGDDGGEAKDTLTIAVQADMADKDPINGSSTNDT